MDSNCRREMNKILRSGNMTQKFCYPYVIRSIMSLFVTIIN